MNNYLLWAQLVTSLAASVAQSRGANSGALAYLSLLSIGLRSGRLTDQELTQLSVQIQQAIADNRPVTRDQLDEIDSRIQQASAAIQGQIPPAVSQR